MSDNNQDVQDMDVDTPDPQPPHPQPQGEASPTHQDEVSLTLSLKWLESKKPQKPQKQRMLLEKSLQSWFNRCTTKVDCSVEEPQADGSVVIKIKPPPAVNELMKLKGETLMEKDGTKPVTILSISLGSSKMDTPTADDASVNSPPAAASINTKPSVADLAVDKMQLEGQKEPLTAKGNPPQDDKNRSEDCVVPLGLYWYISQIYKNEITRIEEETKVTITPSVTVKFDTKGEDGKPDEALSRFTDLVQRYLPDSRSSVIPLKFVDPDQWSDALKVIKDSNKLLVTMSSEEITVCGPDYCQKSLSSTLTAMQKSSTSFGESERPSWSQNFNGDLSLKIRMTIKDDLGDAGLTLEENHWKTLNTSYKHPLAKIQSKFNVDFKESNISEGKVNVKASYKGPGRNAAMESHAVRALLRLYQKIMTSSRHQPPPYGFSGLSGSEETTRGPGLNGHSTQNSEESTGGGATGDSRDDKCCICLSHFTDKQQLKCKHEFCKECLQNAMKFSGPICPICKDIFGEVQGTQPDGTMRWNRSSISLPGFPHCGHISITYNIPSGTQKENHPNPGRHYTGTTRSAFLPDNKEGNEVLQLLKKAFDQKLIFTVGASRTTGAENMVTWNDIHHKTSIAGGPERFGYPDKNYLSRVKDELKSKGIE
uniref:E3 ubiquitin-protein ligase n=1 Tax=Fundulus heteroclitus TaxID=8078 RepID=A0A3Q2P455_FUNHE